MTLEEAMRKARACLRLAERGGTPEEAAAAAAAAQKIIDRYGLDIKSGDFETNAAAKDAEEVKDFSGDPMDTTTKYDGWWAIKLFAHLCHLNGVFAFQTNMGDKGRILKCMGRPSDVQVVRYLYGYLKNEVKRLQTENCKGHSGVFKYQYGLGVVDTINRKLTEQRKQTDQEVKSENTGMALVRVEKALVKRKERALQAETFARSKMKFDSARASGSTRSNAGYEARLQGRRDGESIRIGGARAGLGSGQRQLQ